jgi:hypothetical protein
MLQNTRRIGSTQNLLWFALDRIQQGTQKVYIVAANEKHKQHIKKEIDKMGGLPDGIRVTTINEPILGNGESTEFIVDHYTYESEIAKLSGMVEKRDEYIHDLQESLDETKNTLKQYKELCDNVANEKRKQDSQMTRLRKELCDRQADIDEYDDEVVYLKAENKKLKNDCVALKIERDDMFFSNNIMRKQFKETQIAADNFLASFQAAGEDFDRVNEENKKLKDELKKIKDDDLKRQDDLLSRNLCPKCASNLRLEMSGKDRTFWEPISEFKRYPIGGECSDPNCGWSYGTMRKGK